MTIDRLALDRDVVNPARVDFGQKIGIGQIGLGAPAGRVLEQVEERDEQQANDDPERQVLREIVHVRYLSISPA